VDLESVTWAPIVVHNRRGTYAPIVVHNRRGTYCGA